MFFAEIPIHDLIIFLMHNKWAKGDLDYKSVNIDRNLM